MSEAQNALRGFAFFLAWFFGGLFVFYGLSGRISTQPFVRIFLLNLGISYFDFISFWFWLIIVPFTFWYYVIRAAAGKNRRAFQH